MTIVSGEEFNRFGTVEKILSPHQDPTQYQVLYSGERVSWIDERFVVVPIMANQVKVDNEY